MSETEKLIGFEKVLAESARQLKAEREETRKHIAQLEVALSDLMNDYAKRVRNGQMLKPYLQARRLVNDD